MHIIEKFIDKLLGNSNNSFITVNRFFWFTLSIHAVLYFSNVSEYILNLISSKIIIDEKVYTFIFYILTLFLIFEYISYYRISIKHLYYSVLESKNKDNKKIKEYLSYLEKNLIAKFKTFSYILIFYYLISLLKYYKHVLVYIFIFIVLKIFEALRQQIVIIMHNYKGN